MCVRITAIKDSARSLSARLGIISATCSASAAIWSSTDASSRAWSELRLYRPQATPTECRARPRSPFAASQAGLSGDAPPQHAAVPVYLHGRGHCRYLKTDPRHLGTEGTYGPTSRPDVTQRF